MRVATIKITSIAVVPDSDLPVWSVMADVLRTHAGTPPDPQVEFLVHSPSRAFRTSEPLGKTFTISWPDEAGSPYSGPFTLIH